MNKRPIESEENSESSETGDGQDPVANNETVMEKVAIPDEGAEANEENANKHDENRMENNAIQIGQMLQDEL